jgi:hypothetical protein
MESLYRTTMSMLGGIALCSFPVAAQAYLPEFAINAWTRARFLAAVSFIGACFPA